MGKLYNTAGTEIEQSAIGDYTDEVAQPSKYTVIADVYEGTHLPGSTTHGRRLKWYNGQTITQADMDDAFLEATATAISPATGPAAGGTVVTITGTNLHEARGVTFDGVAATAFSVLSPTQIRCTTPANTAGTSDVVIDLAAGDVTKSAFYTFT